MYLRKILLRFLYDSIRDETRLGTRLLEGGQEVRRMGMAFERCKIFIFAPKILICIKFSYLYFITIF